MYCSFIILLVTVIYSSRLEGIPALHCWELRRAYVRVRVALELLLRTAHAICSVKGPFSDFSQYLAGLYVRPTTGKSTACTLRLLPDGLAVTVE